jgi:hypothetical protein
MSLFKPGVWTTSNGEDLHICWRNAKALSICPARSDRAENFLAHATVDELSHFIPMLACCRDGSRCSKANHARNTPVSSRSFIVIVCVSNSCMISFGKSTDQTMYLHVFCGGGDGSIQTPPAACLQASVYPSMSGVFGTI